MPSTPDLKARIREDVLAIRDGKSEAWRAEASAAIGRQIAGLAGRLGEASVAGYWPFGSEADPRPLMQAIAALGRTLCLPIIRRPEIFFRRFAFGDRLVDAGWGTFGPGPEAPEVTPKALLVPLAAFDALGGRIGWGKGHYDRAIARLTETLGHPPVTVGIAFSFQRVEHVPVEAHDRRLDCVVTETGLHISSTD